MKAENLLDAMGYLDESLLAEHLPQKHRNFRPLVAVAAVAAALCVTVAATAELLSDWLLEDKGKADPEEYRAEAEAQWPNLDEQTMNEHIRRNTEKFTYNLSTHTNHLALEPEVLKMLHEFVETHDEYEEVLTYDSVDDLSEALSLPLLQSDLLTPKAPVEMSVDNVFQMGDRTEAEPVVTLEEEEPFTVNGEVFTNAVPYGFQVMIDGSYSYEENDLINVGFDYEFFTATGCKTQRIYHLEQEAAFFVEVMDNMAVRLGLGEDCALAFFTKDGVAYSITITRHHDKEITGAELETILREIIASLY